MAFSDKLVSVSTGYRGLNRALGSADGGVLLSRLAHKNDAQTLLRTGGLAAIAGLAWEAYNIYRSGRQRRDTLSPQWISRRRFEEILDARHENPFIWRVVQAMITGGQADRRYSQFEQTQIWQCAMDLGATGAELAAMTETMANPPSIDDLAESAMTLEAQVALYLASFLATEERSREGQGYLRQLARRLRLPHSLVEALESQLQTEPVAA